MRAQTISQLQLTNDEARMILKSAELDPATADKFPDVENPKETAESNNRIRAKWILASRSPGFIDGIKEYYRLVRDLNPVTFVAERGYQIGSGEEMFTGDKVSRVQAVVDLLVYLAFLKGVRDVADRESSGGVGVLHRAACRTGAAAGRARPTKNERIWS